MMGQLPAGQNALFYEFCLEKHVPPDHLLRQIDIFLDLSHLREHLTDFYSATGRPSIDPELMIRMLIVGYCFGIRSERQLCEEVHLNLAYRWFCRLGLEGEVPDHSTFSKNRHGRFRESEAFRIVFQDVVARCMAEGLIHGEGFAIDASTIKADASKQRCVPGAEVVDWDDSAIATRPVREYLSALDGNAAIGTVPKAVSLTDPQARWTAAPGGPAFFAYSTNYLIDIAHGVILDVEATPAYRTAEVDVTKTLLERVEEHIQLKPQKLIGDTAYGAAPMLGWLVDEKAIAPHIPVWDKSQRRDGTFSNGEFVWDGEADQYRCPAGKALRPRQKHYKNRPSRVTKANTIIYATRKADCCDCELKEQCCPNDSVRKIRRSVFEDARNAARRIARTREYRQSRCDRKKVEMLFAHLKRILRFDRLRLRGLSGANDEFLLAATAQNLRKLAKLRGHGPPDCRIGAPA